MILVDFKCAACDHVLEDLVPSETATLKCPRCSGEMTRTLVSAPKLLVEIVPDYPGAKARKAGYQHTTHAAQPATKIQSGYGGCQGPK